MTVVPVLSRQDWDVSRDPGLLKALEVAKRLGRRQPPHLVWRPRQPQLDLAPARVRRLTNPRAGAVSCSAAVYRNLAGYGSGTGQQLGQYFSTFMIPFIFESIMPQSGYDATEPSNFHHLLQTSRPTRSCRWSTS